MAMLICCGPSHPGQSLTSVSRPVPRKEKREVLQVETATEGCARVIYWFHSEGHPAVLLLDVREERSGRSYSRARKVLMREAQELLEDFGGSR